MTPAGELDLSNATLLGDVLDEAATTHSRIVLDLHQLTFMDSTGITSSSLPIGP